MTTIGVYWGKFDPPHVGHEHVIREVLAQALVDFVWLVPQYDVSGASAYTRRTAWAQALASEVGLERVGVSSAESWLSLQRPGPVGLLEVLRYLSTSDADSSFRLMMGSPEWETYDGTDRAEIEAEFTPLLLPGQVVTSTEIRRRLQAREPVADLIPKAVLDLMYDVGEQPAPSKNEGPAVWDLVIEDMRARDQLGRSRYGTPLQPFNGRKALRDVYEELLDTVVYMRQLLFEEEGR